MTLRPAAASLVLGLLLPLACAHQEPNGGENPAEASDLEEPPPPATEAHVDEATVTDPALPSPSTIGSLLSEEEFKALHTLREDAAPPHRGEMTPLDGTTAYLSLPEGEGPFPGVIVIQEWWGLNEHIKHWADRLAAAGYAALAVDLYGGRVAETPEQAMALMKAVDDARARAILKAAHRFLKEDPRVRAPATASIGWCFGGGWSLRVALMEPELDAAVIYYGRLVTDPQALKAIKAPVLGIFGDQDQGIPPAEVDKFEQALAEAGVTHRILRFDAPHAFANPSGQAYDEESAERAWEATRTFLAEHLPQRP